MAYLSARPVWSEVSTLRIPTLLLVAVILGIAGCRSKPSPNPSKRLVLYSGNVLKEGSFEECVSLMAANGMPLKEALRECGQLGAPTGADAPAIGGIRVDMGPLARNGQHAGPSVTSCAAPPSRGNPPVYSGWSANLGWGGQRKLTPGEQTQALEDIRKALVDAEGKLPKAQQTLETAEEVLEKAWEKYQATAEGTPEREAAAKESQEAVKAWFEAARDEAELEKEIEQLHYYEEHPEELYTPPNVARTAPGSVSTCEEVADFLDQCNAQQWRGEECERFDKGKNECGDRKLVRTDGESGCALPAATAEQTEKAILIACDAGRKRPVPGEDPCEIVLENLGVSKYYAPDGFGPTKPGCNDPQSRVEPEECVGTFRIVEFGVPDLQAIAAFGAKNFGGPLILITTKNPDPKPAPAVDPRPDR